MKKSTRVNHPPAVELPSDNHSVVAPIYQSVKFEFDSLEETERFLRGERSGFFYTRASNPTTRQLEMLLAELQGRDDCLVAASGVGAISQTLLALTKQGDHVICFTETYNPTRYLVRRLRRPHRLGRRTHRLGRRTHRLGRRSPRLGRRSPRSSR